MARKKPIISPLGQWAYPGEVTIIPSSKITMKGVNYPVLGVDDLGNQQMMMPGGEYTFPGNYVTEFPQMNKGGQMIKRKDGSYSKRGLWDNIRANKGSGKKPTKEMLEQERKIKAKMQNGGWLDQYQVGAQVPFSDSSNYSYDKDGNLIYTNYPFGFTYNGGINLFINDRLNHGTEKPLNNYEIDFLENAKKKIENLDIYPQHFDFQVSTQVDKLNPSLEELIKVTQNTYPDQYAIDNSFLKASKSDSKINLPTSAFENDIKERYVIPNALKNSINKSFGTLPTTQEEGYSPNRIWTTKVKDNERSGVGAAFTKPGDYAYILTPNSKKTSGFSKEKINTKKENIENSLSSIDNKFYEDIYEKYPDYIQYPGNYNNPEISLFGDIKNRLPNQMWNRAEQMRVEMLNNPEIKDWADLHNLNLSKQTKDSKQNLVIDDFAPKVPESVYANRLVKAGLPVSTPDYNYGKNETYIAQDPSKFNLAGYFPIPEGYSDENAQELIAKKLGIKQEQLNSKDYLIHYNKSPITEYTPGKKYGGWLEQYQSGGLLSKDDYDLTTAPKRGDYLLPDINRPYYIDDAGERRTEYKIGINVDGKETLIPTVVDGRQLTEDEARDRYRKTGLHMGQFNTPEEADYAARLRTARYKMLEDPVNFKANQFQVGGTLPPRYTSNPNDPRIRSYKDSLSLYKDYTNPIEISKIFKKIKSDPALRYYRSRSAEELNNFPGKIKPISGTEWDYSKLLSDFNAGKNTDYSYYPFYDERGVLSPTKRGTHLSFKKPVQPYIYKKPEVSPIYTSNINDPRLRSYRDSLNLYNSSKYIKEHPLVGNYMPGIEHGRQMDINTDNQNVNKYKPKLALTNTGYYYNYKKPVQPYIYKKPEVVPEVVETPVAPAPVVEPPKPSLFVSNIDRDMYTPNGGMAREYNIGVTLQDGSKKAFRTEKEYQDWKAANNLDISKAKVSEGRGYSYNYPENKKYGGWLNKYQTGGWDNWTPNVGKPYMRTSPAGNAGYSDNTRVSGPDLNNRKAAEAAQYARRSEKNGDTFIKYAKSQINPYNWGVTDYTKSGTRAQAFSAARKAGEKEFMWNDERYNTRKDTDPIKYTGDNPNQEEYDKILRTQYPEFYKILNRGQNVGNISFEGVTDYNSDRAFTMKYPNFVSTGNSKIGVGKNPLSSQEFISNLIAETAHVKDKNLDINIFNPYLWKFGSDFLKLGDTIYDTPGTAEYNAHRLIEPGIAMLAYGNLSPNDIKRIQKNLGVKEDGYFGETTYKALQNKYKDNEYIQEAIENNQILHQNLDNNPIFSRDTEIAKRYLRELNKEVPLKYYDKFKDFRKVTPPIDLEDIEYVPEIDTHTLKVSDYTDAALLSTSGDNMNALLLQQALRKRGYNLPKSTTKYGDLDGKYGDETKNALLDWQNKNITKKQNGGWLNSYQIGGAETSTEQNPDRMQGVDIRKKRSWSDKLRGYVNQFEKKIGLDPYNERSDDFMEQWARRVNTATGGRDWYKQANDGSGTGGIGTAMMETVMAPFSAPQLASVYGATGKVQMPSEAMNIQNPVGSFLADAILDPTNLVGAGIAKNLGKGSLQNMVRSRMSGVRPSIQNSVDNIAIPNISQNVSVSPVAWQAQELPGLHLKSTMTEGPISKIVEPKTGLVNVEQALGIIGKESGGVDKVALIKQSLGENIPKKMDYNDFRKTVQDQLIPLEKQFSTERSDYGIDRLGYAPGKFVTKEVDGKKIHTYESDYLDNQTILFSNKNKFGRGSGAHGNPDETLGHAHYLIDKESPDVLTITQIQSDAFQGTHRVMPKNIDDAVSKLNKTQADSDDVLELMGDEKEKFKTVFDNADRKLQLDKATVENFTQKSLLDKNHQERYLQELVDYAGKQDYLNKVRVPTAETAAKVQNYTPTDGIGNKLAMFKRQLELDEQAIKNAPQIELIMRQANIDHYKKEIEKLSKIEYKPIYSPEHQTILKKYSEQPKTIKKLFGEEPKIVTDSKGNTWYEFDIPKKFKEGKGEIKAFSTIGGIGVAGAAASQLQEQKKGGQTSWLNKYK